MDTGTDSGAGLPPSPPPTSGHEPAAGNGDGSPLPGGGEPLLAPSSDATSQPSQVTSPGAGPPPWFRLVVWDSLLGACCPLLPLPIVDDMALARVRRRMVTRLLDRWGTPLAPHQVALLAGGGRRWTVSRMAGMIPFCTRPAWASDGRAAPAASAMRPASPWCALPRTSGPACRCGRTTSG